MRTAPDRDLSDQVLAFIASELNVDRRRLSEATYFNSDLSLDSVRALNLICEIEDRFKCEIPDRAVPGLYTIGDLVRFIEKAQVQ